MKTVNLMFRLSNVRWQHHMLVPAIIRQGQLFGSRNVFSALMLRPVNTKYGKLEKPYFMEGVQMPGGWENKRLKSHDLQLTSNIDRAVNKAK